MTIQAHKHQSGAISFTITLNGRRKQIAEATPWGTKGVTIERIGLDGENPASSPFISVYHSEGVEAINAVVENWVDDLLRYEFESKVQW